MTSMLSSESSLQYPEVKRSSRLQDLEVGLEYGKDRLLDLLELELLRDLVDLRDLRDLLLLLLLLEEEPLRDEHDEEESDDDEDEDERLLFRILAVKTSNSSLERFLKLYNS